MTGAALLWLEATHLSPPPRPLPEIIRSAKVDSVAVIAATAATAAAATTTAAAAAAVFACVR